MYVCSPEFIYLVFNIMPITLLVIVWQLQGQRKPVHTVGQGSVL